MIALLFLTYIWIFFLFFLLPQLLLIVELLGPVDRSVMPSVLDLPILASVELPPHNSPQVWEQFVQSLDSPNALALVRGLLQVNPQLRLTCQSALGQVFVADEIEVYYSDEEGPGSSSAPADAVDPICPSCLMTPCARQASCA